MIRSVHFESHGSTLSGSLHLPDGYADGQTLPGVVVTGAWTTVKEQMPATYAAALAALGFAALTFDFRGWGQSPDRVPYLEDPKRKTQDILAAFDFLSTRPEVDPERLAGLGICASSGYMSDAVSRDSRVHALALVAPWLHDAEIVEDVYGGAEGVSGLIRASRDAASSEEPVVVEAASTTNPDAIMYQAPYYTEEDRGLIPEYDNRFNVASWEPWLTYDAIRIADTLRTPTLMVHSEEAAIPQGARTFASRMGDRAESIWLDDATQFDFYDRSDIVGRAVDAVAHHFTSTFGGTASEEGAEPHAPLQDEAAVRTVVEGVAVLADRGEFDALERLYGDDVTVDYRSLTGGDVERKSATQLMTEWASLLPGFDRTRHALSDITVEVDGDTASATAVVQADHYVDALHWQVSGIYRYTLERQDGSWKITAHIFESTDESGTRDAIEAALRRAAEHPSSYLVRQQTMGAVRAVLTSLEDKDMDAFAELWAEDAVQEMPYSPDGFPKRVEGKAAVIEHYAAWPENSRDADFTSRLVFHPTLDPHVVFAEWEGRVDIVPTGREYRQTYGGLFHVESGKITLFREYFDPAPFRYAFGLDEGGREG